MQTLTQIFKEIIDQIWLLLKELNKIQMLGHAGIVDFRLIYQYQIKKKKKTHTEKNNNNKHWTETINMKSKLSYGTHSSVRLLYEIKILKKKNSW